MSAADTPDHPRPSLGGPAVTSVRHPLTRAMLALTFTTGLVDAASYLGIGHVFSANMTGNIVLLGFGIAGSGGLPVVAPLVSLAAFLLGAGAGGVLATRVSTRHARHMAFALGIEIALAGAVAGALLLKVSLALVLVAAAAVAVTTFVLYIPSAARAGAAVDVSHTGP